MILQLVSTTNDIKELKELYNLGHIARHPAFCSCRASQPSCHSNGVASYTEQCLAVQLLVKEPVKSY